MSDKSVSPGDCFASIAKANGFFNYRTLYDHADNAALKAKRINPNQLVEDDVVRVPDKRQKWLPLQLDGTKKYVLDRRSPGIAPAAYGFQKDGPGSGPMHPHGGLR